jgi:ribosomal protein S8
VRDGCGDKKNAMVRISVLNDALKNMFNAEKRGKRQVLLKPSSKVIIKFLSVMQKHGTFSTSKNLTQSLSLSELYNHHHHQKQNALHSSSSDAAHEFEAKWV